MSWLKHRVCISSLSMNFHLWSLRLHFSLMGTFHSARVMIGLWSFPQFFHIYAEISLWGVNKMFAQCRRSTFMKIIFCWTSLSCFQIVFSFCSPSLKSRRRRSFKVMTLSSIITLRAHNTGCTVLIHYLTAPYVWFPPSLMLIWELPANGASCCRINSCRALATAQVFWHPALNRCAVCQNIWTPSLNFPLYTLRCFIPSSTQNLATTSIVCFYI